MSDFRTPFEDASPPVTKPQPYKAPQDYTGPQTSGHASSDKILLDIKRARLRILKRVFVALILVAGGGLTGIEWATVFVTGAITIEAIAITVAFMALIAVATALVKWYVLLVAKIVAALLMVIPFWEMLPLLWLILLWLGGALVLTAAGFAVEMRSRTATSINLGVLGSGLGILTLGFSLMLTAIYYGLTLPGEKLSISEEGMTKILIVGQGAIAKIMPGFRHDMSIDEYIHTLALAEEARITAVLEEDPRYLALPEAEKRQARTVALERFRQEAIRHLSETLGQTVNPQQTLASFIHASFNAQIAELSPAAQRALFAVWLAAIFSTIWLLGTLLRPIIVITAWIFLQALLVVRIIEVGRESVERKYLAFT